MLKKISGEKSCISRVNWNLFLPCRDRQLSDYKFFCEDIEPVSFNWTKVDEAMLLSTGSDHSSLDDDDLEDELIPANGLNPLN